MSQKLTIVAIIEAKKDKASFVESELLKLIDPTKKEQGCLEYRLQKDNENPEKFIFFERWESKKLWQTHMESDHLKELVQNTDGMLDKLEIKEMSEIA